MQDYTGNSHRAKEKADKEPNPEKSEGEKKDGKNLDQVVTGPVVQKPKSLGKKMKSIFFGGEFKAASRYILADVLLPAARNAVVDATTKGIERMVYGESYARQSRRPEMRSNIQYHTPLRSQSVMLPGQPPHRARPVARRESNDILIPDRREAEEVLERMIDVVDKYGVASVADLNELLGLPSAHVDHKWGWTNLSTAHIRQLREGHLLELPPLEEI